MSIDAALLVFLSTTEELLRVRVGAEPDDDSKDIMIQLALEATLGLIEDYLDRKLQKLAEVETFASGREAFMVRRWPIEPGSFKLTQSDGQLDMFDGCIDDEKGIIHHRGWGWFKAEYIGGFEKLPSSLLWAFMTGFDALWATTPGLGAAPDSGTILGSGAVKKVSLTGIGAVDLDVGANSLKNSDVGIAKPWSIFPAIATAIFDRYRRESVIGAG